jgi:hypothetical protein
VEDIFQSEASLTSAEINESKLAKPGYKIGHHGVASGR